MNSFHSDILIVGAGVSGLALAGDLIADGRSVSVVDKGRTVGGRVATRCFSDGTLFDFGAQYFTTKGERFTGWIEKWLTETDSTLAVWNRGYPTWADGTIHGREPGHPRYAPRDGMNALPRRLTAAIAAQNIQTSVTITTLERDGARWIANGLRSPDKEPVQFTADSVALTLPPEQLLRLAGVYLPEETRSKLEAVTYAPTWTLVLRLATDIPVTWAALEFANHPVLGQLSRDHTKRLSEAAPVLVVNASSEWSRQHFDADRETVQTEMTDALQGLFEDPLQITEMFLHRWRYALPTHTFGTPFWHHPELALAGCGDACGGIRLENALTTGWQLAEEIIAQK